MSMTDLWGVPLDEQGVYGQDFFYGAWLSDTRALLDLDTVAQRIRDLEMKPNRTGKQETQLEQQRTTLSRRQAVLTTRENWTDWLLEAPPHSQCQWCGRSTTLWVRDKPRTDTVLIPGTSVKFTDAAAWRHPSQDLGLCPSCGLMVKSQNGSAAAFSGVKRDAKILRVDVTHYRVAVVGGATPWWTWPWDHAPALWTHYGPGASAWSKRYWVHHAQPTWSVAAMSLWVNGRLWTVPGEGILAMREDAVAQADALFDAYATNMPADERDALSQNFSRTAASRWRELLGLPPGEEALIYECLWIPTAANLKKYTKPDSDLVADVDILEEVR